MAGFVKNGIGNCWLLGTSSLPEAESKPVWPAYVSLWPAYVFQFDSESNYLRLFPGEGHVEEQPFWLCEKLIPSPVDFEKQFMLAMISLSARRHAKDIRDGIYRRIFGQTP